MTEAPRPPQEAALIRLVRLAAGIKVADAAKQAGISMSRWSQIENGYETREGDIRPVQGLPGTVAHMAYAVGLDAERLEEARPDAAEILREIQRQRAAPPPEWLRAGVRRLTGEDEPAAASDERRGA